MKQGRRQEPCTTTRSSARSSLRQAMDLRFPAAVLLWFTIRKSETANPLPRSMHSIVADLSSLGPLRSKHERHTDDKNLKLGTGGWAGKGNPNHGPNRPPEQDPLFEKASPQTSGFYGFRMLVANRSDVTDITSPSYNRRLPSA